DNASHPLTINGGNFSSGNVVQFKWGAGSGAAVWTTSNSAPTITSSSLITVSMNPGTVTDVINVRVCRSASQTATADCSSGTESVAVATGAPTLSSLPPAPPTADNASHPLTINGGNFSSGNVVQF